MPGMNPGLDAANPALVAAFRAALLRQSGIVAAMFILLMLAYGMARTWRSAATRPPRPAPPAEPKARRFLRIAFGVLWIFDGVLQAQPKMAGGLPSQVIGPVAASSPRWVQHLVNAGGTVWSYHPVQAATAAVWIQAGLGLWLIAAEAGWSSRLAGLASAAWGLIVWVFGEAFGGIFAPGLTWLSGAPGAVLLYVVAGGLIALPPLAWAWPRARRLLLTGIGMCWAGMAVLQAWPGRGFWQGGDSGTLAGMVRSMAQIAQPHTQAAMVSAFASFAAGHGFAVNLFAVIALGALGVAFVIGRPGLLRAAVPAAVVFCAVDWALVQDFGIPGGLGTDPNSMVPWVVLLCVGYLAVTQPTDLAERAVVSPVRTRFSLAAAFSHAAAFSLAALRPAALREAMISVSARSVTALGALGVVLVGAAPMAAATAGRTADPIIARALAGASLPLDRPAPGFRLISQDGRPASLASLRGKVVMLTFLDPVCTDCPVIAQEMKAASTLLGASGDHVEFVAIAANSTHSHPGFIRAFDRQEDMTTMPDWLFLTGTITQLQQVWNQYETVAPRMMAGMTARSDITFVIDKAGQIRQEIRNAPGPGTASARSSFAVLLSDVARQTLECRTCDDGGSK